MRMFKLSYQSLILKITFILSIAIVFFLSAIVYKQLKSLDESEELVRSTYEVNIEIEEMLSSLKDVISSNRGYIISRDSSYLKNSDVAILNLKKNLKKLRIRVNNNSIQKKHLDSLELHIDNRIDLAVKTRGFKGDVEDSELIKTSMIKAKNCMDTIQNIAYKMIEEEKQLLNSRRKKSDQLSSVAPLYIYLTILLCLIFLIIAYFRINSNLIHLASKNKELKKAFDDIVIANETSKQGEELGKFGNWRWETETNNLYFTDNLYKLVGVEPSSFKPTFENWYNLVHPEDLEYVKYEINEMFKNKILNPLKFRLKTLDGKIKYVKVIGTKNAQKKYIIATTIDITDEVEKLYKIEEQNVNLLKANDELSIVNESKAFGEIIGKYGNWHWNPLNDKWYFSKNLYRLLGVEPNSFPANLDSFYKYIHPEDLELVKLKAQEIFKDENLTTFEYRIIQADSGNIIHVKSLGRSIVKLNGQKLVAGVTVDVTDEFNKNKEILLKNEVLILSEEIGNYGTWQWNITENTFKFSDNLYKIFGFDKNDIPESLDSFLPTIHSEDIEMVNDRINEMLQKKSFEPFTHRIYRNDDKSLRYVHINNKFLMDKNGNEFLLVLTADITETVSKAIELSEKNRTLEANNKELQAFNYVASHDLQEPLRKIQTFISRIEETELQNLSETGKVYLSRIQLASKRMRVLIDDLLQFSRTTRAENTFEKINLNDLLESSKHELAELICEKKAEITNNPFPELKVIPFQIQQLFTNLISNSIKYSKVSETPKIEIINSFVMAQTEELLSKEIEGKFLKIVVRDNGIGFSNEYANKIFELFSRLHNKDQYSGTGIGLAICKKIVENHKGYIFAQGFENKGAEFVIYLPTY